MSRDRARSSEGRGGPADVRGTGSDEVERVTPVVVVGHRPRAKDLPAEPRWVVAPVRHALPAVTLLAAPGRLPLATGSARRIVVDRSVPEPELEPAAAEAARVLAPGGELVVELPGAVGAGRSVRSVFATLLSTPRPLPLDRIPAALATLGFDRIGVEFPGGGVARYTARRAPGRPWDLLFPEG